MNFQINISDVSVADMARLGPLLAQLGTGNVVGSAGNTQRDKTPAEVAAAGANVTTIKPQTTKVEAGKGNAAGSTQPATAGASNVSSTEGSTSAGGQAGSPQGGGEFPYATLQAAVFKLAGKNRDAVPPLLAQFGVASFKDLDPSRWAEAHGIVNECLAALEAA